MPLPKAGKHAHRGGLKSPRIGRVASRLGRQAAPTQPRTSGQSLTRVAGLTALALATTGAAYAGPAFSANTQPALSNGTIAASLQSLQPAETPARQTTTTAAVPDLRVEREVRISRDNARRAPTKSTRAKLSPSRGSKARQKRIKLAAKAEMAAARHAWHLPITKGAYRLSAEFGQCSSLWSSCHTGLDFAAASGTPIKALASGVITEAAYAGAYGNRTILKLDDGTQIWYCHQTSFNAWPGQRVVAGQTIGYVGSTGNSTGSHLHLEVRPGGGDPVDPFAALAEHGVRP